MNQSLTIFLAIIFGSIIIAGGIYFGLTSLGNKTVISTEEEKILESRNSSKNLPPQDIPDYDKYGTKKPTSQNSADSQTQENANKNDMGNSQVDVQQESDQQQPDDSNQSDQTKDITFTKTELIKALSDQTGIDEDKIEFSIGDQVKKDDKILLQGTVKESGYEGGGGFFAVVDENGVKVTYSGQGVPECKDIDPYGYPKSWADYCLDANGNPVER